MNLGESEFVEQFEAATLQSFHHADHVRIAWIYLKKYSPSVALQRFCRYLKQFAAAKGNDNLYHETITWAYFLLIQERLRRSQSLDWENFVKQNPDLMDWKDSILKKYYKDETLKSQLAREIFVLPDRLIA